MKKTVLSLLFIVVSFCLYADDIEDLLRVGTAAEIREAYERGANLTLRFDDMETALMIAAERNQNPDVIRYLLELGIDVNAREEDQKTALMFAAEKNRNIEILKVLIEAGADVNAADEDGETALMYAAEENRNPAVIVTLLEAGADPDLQDEDGRTALMIAADESYNPQVITALLNGGADVFLTDYAGRSACDYAKNNPVLQTNQAIMSLLKKKSGQKVDCPLFCLVFSFQSLLRLNMPRTLKNSVCALTLSNTAVVSVLSSMSRLT